MPEDGNKTRAQTHFGERHADRLRDEEPEAERHNAYSRKNEDSFAYSFPCP